MAAKKNRGGGGGGSGKKKNKGKGTAAEAPPPKPSEPEPEPEPEEDPVENPKGGGDDGDDDDDSSVSVYDSADEEYDSGAEEEEDAEDDDGAGSGSDDDDDDDDDFEDQGSSDEEDDLLERQAKEANDDGESDDELEILDDDGNAFDSMPRTWRESLGKAAKKPGKKKKRAAEGGGAKRDSSSPRAEDGEGKENGEDAEEDKANVTVHDPAAALYLHADDLSSDDEDEDGTQNRIGRVPLHWYDEHDHVGYDVHGSKVIKSDTGDRLDQALKGEDDMERGKFTVRDGLNARDVELTPRQLELIRRVQGGAFAHPEFEAHPEGIDYYSSQKEISGLNSGAHPPKARFQPSKWEKLQVRRLLHRLKSGAITQDYLEGKVRDMNDLQPKNKKQEEEKDDKPFLLWKGDEEDELAMRKGPQHVAAPKLPPPGHAESYIPPDEYLPTENDLKEWEDLDPQDRPHGHLIPKKFPNLRSVGAYEHAVRDRFERCLDLYMCPRQLKRRLNIDPESLVPSLPKARDLRPFPTAKAVEYVTPYDEEGGEERPMVRCLAVSPDGQFLASGASDGVVRLWEVQTGRLLRSWDVSGLADDSEKEEGKDKKDEDGEGEEKDSAEDKEKDAADESKSDKAKPKPKPVVALEWNPNKSHHCLLAACGRCAFVLAAGTGGSDDAELTDALLHACGKKGGANVKSEKVAKAVKWIPVKPDVEGDKDAKPVSAFASVAGPVCVLRTNKDVSSVKWHRKGDYFVTVSPKAAAAAVLIHQLSKANSQRPFSKVKGGEAQTAAFHPKLPFLFVATPQHIRVYHLVKQQLVKKLLTGCRWVSTIDVHPTGDHVLVGSLDRRVVWFDLDLSSTPYKTLKYHDRAVRSASYHRRYPLMASASDDGSVHVFHSTVYSDLMRNPLVVPVKILRAHKVTEGTRLGALGCAWHPSQPWVFTCGADGRIWLFQDI